MLKFICFSAFVVVASAAPRAAPLAWTDCATDPSNRVLTVHEFDFQPNPIVIPGELHITINATVNRRIDQLFIDTEVIKLGGLFTAMTVPCIGDTNFGSCQNIDGCSILDKILYGSSVIPSNLGLSQQFYKLLLTALGHHATCPINPESVVIHNKKITLQPLRPLFVAALGNGDYSVKIMLKDDPTSTDNVGCLSFNAGIVLHKAGEAVGKK